MIVELQRFIEFNAEWHNGPRDHTRFGMNFETMAINTEYVAWVRRYVISGGFDFCQVHMADRGGEFILDKTYEEMRDLLKGASRPPNRFERSP